MEQVHNRACPACNAAGVEKPLKSRAGRFAIYCDVGHEYDSVQLSEMPVIPLKNPPPPKGPKILPNQVKMEISLPERLKTDAQAKYKERLNPTLVALLAALMQPGSFLLMGEDIEKLVEILGQRPDNAQKLFGAVKNLHLELASVRGRLEQMETAKPGQQVTASNSSAVMLHFDDETQNKLADRARGREMPLTKLLEETIIYGLQNGWL